MNILDYIKGIRKGSDAHKIEQEAMNDPFLADAIDGYDSVDGDHLANIANIQAHVSKRSSSKSVSIYRWKIAVAAVVFIGILGGYFSLMNHQSTMLIAQEKNLQFINIHIPDSYIQSKNLELADAQNIGSEAEIKALVDISNLEEVIKPIQRIDIFVPESYYAQLNKDEVEDLAKLEKKYFSKKEKPSREADLYAEVVAESSNDIKEIEQVPILASSPLEMIQHEKSPQYLSGKVVDETNEPLLGATVKLKGTKKSAMTDIDGHYNIQIDSGEGNSLVVDYMGYETTEIPKAKDNEMIAMRTNNQILQEIAVVGYGVSKKSARVGSVSSVLSSHLETKNAQKPMPVDGDKKYDTYIKKNRMEIFDASCKNTEGTVILSFNITSEGRPSGIVVEKSICEVYDKEAIRLLKEGPAWTNSDIRGELKINFKQ